MANLIGVVSKVVGQVFAVAADGGRRALVEGDRLYAGEQLETGAAGAVAVHLENGAELTLGRDSSLQLSPDLLANHASHVNAPETVTPSQAQLTDVEKLQQAIAAGADPSQEGEAPAAGPGNGGSPSALGGGHSFVQLTEVGGHLDPVIGFPTAGFNSIPEIPEPWIGARGDDQGPGGFVPPVIPPVEPPIDHPVTLDGLEVNGGELTVYEKNLADGSSPDNGALTQSGSFTVHAPDGLHTLTVGGINVVIGGVVSGFPQSITTGLGNTLTITGYNPATGVVSYSYTLLDNEAHPAGQGINNIGESFSVVAIDSDGSKATGSLDVNIVDDVPQARPDSASVVEGGTVTGNVLHNDSLGADRPPVEHTVVGVRAGSDTSTSAIGSLGVNIAGIYGTLVLNANGEAVYKADPNAVPPAGATDVFTYTIRDADGDESTTTITINVTDSKLVACPDSVTVYEKALDLVQDPQDLAPGTVVGSNPGSAGETATGTLAGSVGGGSGALTFTLVGSSTGAYGQIQINADGSYKYTLTSAPQVGGGNDGANVVTSETFTYKATDALGNSVTSTIVIKIVDDVPRAESDSTTVVEGGTVTGNVLDNDTLGADGAAQGGAVVGVRAGSDTSTSAIGSLGVSIAGTYGTLILNANGEAIYKADPNSVAPAGATDVFTYTIRDADGDESTTTITINVTDSKLVACPDSVTVYEKALDLVQDPQDLAPGTVVGSNPGSAGETATGTLAGSVGGGSGALTFTLVGSSTGAYGQIQINADGSYKYTLTSAPQVGGGNDGANVVTSETFTYKATDALGNSVTSTIVIKIVDDVPRAESDSTTVVEGGTVTGNVLDNDTLGADGAAQGGAVVGVRAGADTSTSAIGSLGVSIAGTYGTLILNANGEAIYKADPNSVAPTGAKDVFTYTIRDADGDESTTTITINVTDSKLVACPDDDIKVYERGLDLVQDAWDLAPGTVEGSAPTRATETSVGNLQGRVGGGSGALTYSLEGSAIGNYGQIQINADGSYKYTLTSAPHIGNGNDGANVVSTETFTYKATDALGNSVTSTIVIHIVDDMPIAESDSATVMEGGTVTGNVLLNDILGADGAAQGGAVVGVRAGSDTSTSAIGSLGVSIAGTYGTLILNANGEAIYKADPNSVAPTGAKDVFTYTIRDADGDESTTTITINVTDSKLVACPDDDIKVYERGLDLVQDAWDLAPGTVEGSAPTRATETSVGNLQGRVGGGSGALTYSLEGSAIGNYGQIQINADGSYKYTLTSAPHIGNGNDGANVVSTETFTYKATDALGNSVTSTIVIHIVDDMPIAESDSATVMEGGTVTGNVLLNDILGADGAAQGGAVVGVRAGADTSTSAIGSLGVSIAGTYGTLILNANGEAIYKADPNSVAPTGAKDVFTYTIRDADGDESTTTITINVTDSKLVACADTEVKVYEKALDLTQDPQDLAPGTVVGSNPTSPGETGTGTLVGSVTGGSGALTYTLVGSTTGAYGQIQLNADGSYKYTLTSAPHIGNGDDGANIVTSETFTYKATDQLGNSVTSTIVIKIVDDVPRAESDSTTVVEGGTVTGNVLDNDTLGADGPAQGGAVVGVRFGADTSTSAIGSLGVGIAGTYGTLILHANGEAEYKANPNAVTQDGAQDTFTYTIRDADGDESTTTITINVTDSKIVACPNNEVTVYEKALDLSQDPNDLAPGTVTGSDPGSAGETATGSLVGSVSGASGAITYTLVGSSTGAYGQIQLNADGSFKYTLTSAPKTAGGLNDGPNVVTSETFVYKATDAAGNSTTSNIVINIVDDVPTTADAVRSTTPGQVDTNVMLIIDVSGSMADNSGVRGLSRLELAKEAIGALLDKYDDMGDVKVQVVTFSTGASDRTDVWVTVAEAKALIKDLTPGGSTYYDSAVNVAQTAYQTPGKLEGAQSVSYFFSDGAPTSGHALTETRTGNWENFLGDNGIKSYAIGLGSGVNTGNLNPAAYDGSTHTNTNSVVVTNLAQLDNVLSGTVQGAPITGSLMSGGDFGADGGFIKSLLIDGTTYTFDPKGNANQPSYAASGGADRGTFDASTHSITVKTALGGTLVVDMDNGQFTYTPPKDSGSNQVETIRFVASDNDGDLSGANLVINVNTNAAPVAGADHVITNILAPSISVPAAALLANDSDANHDRLSAAPITFNTGWTKGADFTAGNGKTVITFTGQDDTLANQERVLARSAFTGAAGSMTAALVVSGYLGAVSAANGNDEDVIKVSLREGETLTLDHNRTADRNLLMQWKDEGGTYHTIADGGSFTASHDGVYSIHLVNQVNDDGGKGAESYQLNMSINYAGAHDYTPTYNGTYTVSDGHGGSATGAVDITYRAGSTLEGTSHDDVLLAGSGDDVLNGGAGNDVLIGGDGNDKLYGGDGNDLLIGGNGNDLLDGGAGNDTASYAGASAGVTVSLALTGEQNTIGAGLDKLVSIENLIGSDHDDKLTGDDNANTLIGGLGNDILIGGGGDDLLIGGPGNNTLTGGAGSDTFLWQQGNTGHDKVTDFTPGTDRLDLSQLLQGENATSASLDDYLHFTVTGTGNGVISTIQVSAVAGAAPTQTIELAGVDLAHHYGVTAGAGGVISAGADTATVINGMLNDHSLKVDTV
ncbi:retention module-containing protein [Pseudomonas sp. AE27]